MSEFVKISSFVENEEIIVYVNKNVLMYFYSMDQPEDQNITEVGINYLGELTVMKVSNTIENLYNQTKEGK